MTPATTQHQTEKTAARMLAAAFRQVWGREPTVNELAILGGHSLIEGYYGLATFVLFPPGVKAGERQACPKKGDPDYQRSPRTNNWGAVMLAVSPEKGRELVAQGRAVGPVCDSRQGLGIYPAFAKAYPTREAGALHYVQVATKQNGRDQRTMPALASGSVQAYTDAQLATKYFMLAPGQTRESKARGLEKAVRQFASRAGLPWPERVAPHQLKVPGLGAFGLFAALAAAATLATVASKGKG